MRILHLISDLSGGGAERQLSYVAPALAQRGHNVHVGYVRPGEVIPSMPGVSLTRLETRSNHDPHLFAEVGRLVDRVRPEVLHTWILQMDIVGGAVAALKAIPWVLREPTSEMAYHPGSWKYWVRVQMARAANVIICNSHGGEEYWRRRLPASRRVVVRNGLPVGEIDRADRAALPEGLGRNAPIVLYVGRLSADRSATKNLTQLMRALCSVKREMDLTGVFCGEGPQRRELMALQKDLGLSRDVLFTGHLPPVGVWGLMKSAAAFVSLSAYEGTPNAVMEAMACGCPLVLSDIAAHREIADETCAVFVQPKDSEGAAAAIVDVLRNVESATARARVARARAELWSTDKMVDEFESIYEEVR